MMIEFPIPEGMTRTKIAETFAAYLMVAEAFTNPRDPEGKLYLAPYPSNAKLSHWQLDGNNNFWLNFPEGKRVGQLNSRTEHRERELKAFVELFNARYNPFCTGAA